MAISYRSGRSIYLKKQFPAASNGRTLNVRLPTNDKLSVNGVTAPGGDRKTKRGRTFDTQTTALLHPSAGWDDGNLPLMTAYQTDTGLFDL